jgi:hypothetical protein
MEKNKKIKLIHKVDKSAIDYGYITHKQMKNKKELTLPVKKGDIISAGAVSVGANGDLMFLFGKTRFRLFLKNPKKKPVVLGSMIKLKVVKLFPKLGYVELI